MKGNVLQQLANLRVLRISHFRPRWCCEQERLHMAEDIFVAWATAQASTPSSRSAKNRLRYVEIEGHLFKCLYLYVHAASVEVKIIEISKDEVDDSEIWQLEV